MAKKPLYPHVPSGSSTSAPRHGVSVPGIVRELLVQKRIMDYAEAVKFSEEVDRMIAKQDWLETLNGTTFEKTFVPRPGGYGMGATGHLT